MPRPRRTAVRKIKIVITKKNSVKPITCRIGGFSSKKKQLISIQIQVEQVIITSSCLWWVFSCNHTGPWTNGSAIPPRMSRLARAVLRRRNQTTHSHHGGDGGGRLSRAATRRRST